jgi:transcriptional regulator GlxA family with amidase domain
MAQVMKTSVFMASGMVVSELWQIANPSLSRLIFAIMQCCMQIMRSWQVSDPNPRHIGVLLFESFSNHCLANAVEPLRAANTLLGRTVYDWTFLSMDGAAVTSSSGLPVAVASALSRSKRGDVLMVIPSYEYRALATPASLRSLRAAAQRYGVLVGMDTGSWLLAAAGLLNGRRATIHWDEIDDFRETFPEVQVSRARTVFDGDIWSCGGAMTAFELVLRMIGDTHGEALRLEVAALFMHTEGDFGPVPPALRPRARLVSGALAIMRENLEEPLAVPALAQVLAIKARKLEGLFRAELGATPQKVYRRIRLLSARRLVEQTSHSIAEIALRCGYADPSAMTRAFRAEFGAAPRNIRANPEI